MTWAMMKPMFNAPPPAELPFETIPYSCVRRTGKDDEVFVTYENKEYGPLIEDLNPFNVKKAQVIIDLEGVGEFILCYTKNSVT